MEDNKQQEIQDKPKQCDCACNKLFHGNELISLCKVCIEDNEEEIKETK